jgi:hypothetical protein
MQAPHWKTIFLNAGHGEGFLGSPSLMKANYANGNAYAAGNARVQDAVRTRGKEDNKKSVSILPVPVVSLT